MKGVYTFDKGVVWGEPEPQHVELAVVGSENIMEAVLRIAPEAVYCENFPESFSLALAAHVPDGFVSMNGASWRCNQIFFNDTGNVVVLFDKSLEQRPVDIVEKELRERFKLIASGKK